MAPEPYHLDPCSHEDLARAYQTEGGGNTSLRRAQAAAAAAAAAATAAWEQFQRADQASRRESNTSSTTSGHPFLPVPVGGITHSHRDVPDRVLRPTSLPLLPESGPIPYPASATAATAVAPPGGSAGLQRTVSEAANRAGEVPSRMGLEAMALEGAAATATPQAAPAAALALDCPPADAAAGNGQGAEEGVGRVASEGAGGRATSLAQVSIDRESAPLLGRQSVSAAGRWCALPAHTPNTPACMSAHNAPL